MTAAPVEHIELAVLAFAECGNLQRARGSRWRFALPYQWHDHVFATLARRKCRDHAAEVAEYVATDEPRRLRAAVDTAARDRGTQAAAILRNRLLAATLYPVDCPLRALPGIAEPQGAGPPVETPAPRILQTRRVDLGAILHPGAVRIAERVAEKRIAGCAARDAVRCAARSRVDVDAQHLSQQAAGILDVLNGVAAVAEPDVQESIGAELDVSAKTVRDVFPDRQQDAFRIGIERQACVRACKLGSNQTNCPIELPDVIDVGEAIRREIRMEGEPEQARLARVMDLSAEVDEVARCRDAGIVVEHADPAAQFRREPARRIARSLPERDRR